MARRGDYSNAAQKWANAMKSGQTATNYTDGVNAVTQSPTERAATPEAMRLYQDRVNESVTSGKRERALRAVSLADWKNQTVNIGAKNLANGANKGLNKMQRHFQEWGDVYRAASEAARAIPRDGTTATALRKVEAAIEVMKRAAGR